MAQYHPSKNEEINKAKSKFDIWRCNKKNRSEPVPNNLWRIVGELVQKYPASIIFKHLKLNNDQVIKYFSRQFLAKSKQVIKQMPIVEVKNPHVDMNLLISKRREDFQILIQHSKGHQLSVNADKELTFDAITAFIGS
jgi:hypothetical protein